MSDAIRVLKGTLADSAGDDEYLTAVEQDALRRVLAVAEAAVEVIADLDPADDHEQPMSVETLRAAVAALTTTTEGE